MQSFEMLVLNNRDFYMEAYRVEGDALGAVLVGSAHWW